MLGSRAVEKWKRGNGFQSHLGMVLVNFCYAFSWLSTYRPIGQIWLSIVLWAEFCLFKRYVEVLISGTSKCELIWKSGLYIGNKIEIRSLWWALIQYDWCPYKKGKFGHRDRQTQKEDNVKNTRRRWTCDWSEAFTSQGTLRITTTG